MLQVSRNRLLRPPHPQSPRSCWCVGRVWDQIKLVSAPCVNVLMKTMLKFNLNLRIFLMTTNIPHYSYSVSNANAKNCSTAVILGRTSPQVRTTTKSVLYFPSCSAAGGCPHLSLVLLKVSSYSKWYFPSTVSWLRFQQENRGNRRVDQNRPSSRWRSFQRVNMLLPHHNNMEPSSILRNRKMDHRTGLFKSYIILALLIVQHVCYSWWSEWFNGFVPSFGLKWTCHQFPAAFSGCLSSIRRSPILVRIRCLNALQLSAYNRIKAIIQYFSLKC